MSTNDVGSILRMVGPLIQIGFLTLLIKHGREGTIVGLPSDFVIWGGFLFGFALSATGMLLSRKRRRAEPSDRIDRPLNL